jgi:hypothetical protein
MLPLLPGTPRFSSYHAVIVYTNAHRNFISRKLSLARRTICVLSGQLLHQRLTLNRQTSRIKKKVNNNSTSHLKKKKIALSRARACLRVCFNLRLWVLRPPVHRQSRYQIEATTTYITHGTLSHSALFAYLRLVAIHARALREPRSVGAAARHLGTRQLEQRVLAL